MSYVAESRRAVGNRASAGDWQGGFRWSFKCAGRVCWVSLAAVRADDGSPRFQVHWLPDRPARLLPADVAVFDAGKRQAKAAILAHLTRLETT